MLNYAHIYLSTIMLKFMHNSPRHYDSWNEPSYIQNTQLMHRQELFLGGEGGVHVFQQLEVDPRAFMHSKFEY